MCARHRDESSVNVILSDAKKSQMDASLEKDTCIVYAYITRIGIICMYVCMYVCINTLFT